MERVAWLVAVGLGAYWAGTRVLAWVAQRQSLAAFEKLERTAGAPAPGGDPEIGSSSPAPAAPDAPSGGVDQRLWGSTRIRAYARALTLPAPPPLAVLRIPRLGLEVPVLEGTAEVTLDRALGHIEGTARPGKPGNVGIAGHRDGFFRVLKDIATGDVLELVLPTGTRLYRVDQLSVVQPNDVRVLAPTKTATITLVTCYPFYFVGPAPQRFIVQARAE